MSDRKMIYGISLVTIKACLLAGFYPYIFLVLKDKISPKIQVAIFFLFLLMSWFVLENRTAFFCIGLIGGVHLFKPKIKSHGFIFVFFIFCILLFELKFQSSIGRLFVWKTIISNLNAFWIKGLGFNSFNFNYSNWQIDYFKKNTVWDIYHFIADCPEFALNEWLNFWVEFGIIGPICLSIFAYYNIKCLYISRSRIEKAATASNAVILVFSLFSYPLHTMCIVCLLVFNTALIVYFRFPKFKQITFLFSSIVLCFLFYAIARNSIFERKWLLAKEFPFIESEKKLTSYKLAELDCDCSRSFFKDYSEFLMQANLDQINISLISKNLTCMNQFEAGMLLGIEYYKTRNIGMSKLYLRQAHFLIPNRFQPMFYMMNIELEEENFRQMRVWANLILTTPVKVKSAYIDYIKEKAKINLITHTN